MKTRIGILMIGLISCLFVVGSAGAQQVLLPGANIPKFIDPLPVAGGIRVVDAMSSGTTEYTIRMREFQAQILPSVNIPLPAGGTSPPWICTESGKSPV